MGGGGSALWRSISVLPGLRIPHRRLKTHGSKWSRLAGRDPVPETGSAGGRFQGIRTPSAGGGNLERVAAPSDTAAGEPEIFEVSTSLPAAIREPDILEASTSEPFVAKEPDIVQDSTQRDRARSIGV